MKTLHRLYMLVLAGGLVGCATQASPDGGAEVDSTYLLFEQRSAPEAPPARLAAYLKAQPRDGMLGVCGVVLADGPDSQVDGVWALLRDPGSHITWGSPAVVPALESYPRVPSAFLPGSRAGLIGRDLAAVPKPRAACVKTNQPWKPEFATEPMRLVLTRTPPASPAPMYIYTPPPRRGK